jgi:hypothetical protein
MTDVHTIASRYIDLWNERMPGRRREILKQHWPGIRNMSTR